MGQIDRGREKLMRRNRKREEIIEERVRKEIDAGFCSTVHPLTLLSRFA